MASMVFTHGNSEQVIKFDSSPQYTLPKYFGWAEGSVELEETEQDAETITFKVLALPNKDSARKVSMGSLLWLKTSAMWQRHNRGL